MSIFNPMTWGNKSAPEIETKSSQQVLGLSPELGSFLAFGRSSAATAAGAMSLYRESTAVSIPVNYISEAFASIDPVLKEGTKIITDHPVLELLRHPSDFFSKCLFFENIAKNYLIAGECEIVAAGSISRPPLELMPINPSNISVVQGPGGIASSIILSGDSFAGSYVLDTRGSGARYLNGTLSELKQIRNYSTRNNSLLYGQSVLVSAAAEVRQQILGNTHNVSLLEHGGRVSLVFNFDGDLNADDYQTTKSRIAEQYGGAGNAGRTLVTSGGKLSVDELGKSNKDMDFAQLQQMARQAVALQYKFPLPLIDSSATTFNNVAAAKTSLYDDAVLPLADVLLDGLSSMLLPRYGMDPAKTKITYDMDQITALTLRRNEELKLRKELGVESTNEIRAMLGREPIEGGDDVLAPANLIPIGTDLLVDDNTAGNTPLARDID